MTSAFHWISLKTRRGISARFSKMPERCVAARCGNIKDEANGISILWHHMPAKTEEAKEMDRFYAGAEEDVDARLERPRPCARCTSMTRISQG